MELVEYLGKLEHANISVIETDIIKTERCNVLTESRMCNAREIVNIIFKSLIIKVSMSELVNK